MPIADKKLRRARARKTPKTITAALLLAEFAGTVPWAHLDIAATVRAESSESWRAAGATGFGVRLLADLVQNFTRPESHVNGRRK